MIASVAGLVTACALDGAVVEVGGIGLEVQCTPSTLAGLRIGRPARLATSLVVREDSLTLYGFAEEDERALFELLQTASGVGPRVAQAMLAALRPDEIRRAVRAGDTRALTAVPGIGKKGAERLVLELRDRIGSAGDGPATSGPPVAAGEPEPWRTQVHEALTGLGWSAAEATSALGAVVGPDTPPGEIDAASVLRDAIRTLGQR